MYLFHVAQREEVGLHQATNILLRWDIVTAVNFLGGLSHGMYLASGDASRAHPWAAKVI